MGLLNAVKDKLQKGIADVANKSKSKSNLDISNSRESVESCGPFLRCSSAAKGVWTGSVLVVASAASVPTLSLLHNGSSNASQTIQAEVIASHGTFNFYKFHLTIPMLNETVKYVYEINSSSGKMFGKSFEFFVAGANEPWRWMFFSCNGLSEDVTPARIAEIGGIQPLWRDVMRQHSEKPFHLMVGGGDQVYADPMWTTVPSLMEWLEMKGKENRRNHPWNDRFEREITNFYFDLYTRHFSEEIFKDAMASIPCISTMDDHDAWDGFGTYPDILTSSNVFQNCGRIALLYYLLFQHHTTPERAAKDGLIGKNNAHYSLVEKFGDNLCIALLDTRSERTPSQVMSQESYDTIFQKMNAMQDLKHIFVVTGVPLAYPRLSGADEVLDTFGKLKECANGAVNTLAGTVTGWIAKPNNSSSTGNSDATSPASPVANWINSSLTTVKKGLGKSGLMSSMINHFGLPELSDDLGDHWTHELHVEERRKLVERLQKISLDKKCRVTLMAGDVHCTAIGRFYSSSNESSLDHRYMIQITSSAIGNVPPPAIVLQHLNRSGKQVHTLNNETKEGMLDAFKDDPSGQTKCLGKRNYCVMQGDGKGGWDAGIVVEGDTLNGATKVYAVNVPAMA